MGWQGGILGLGRRDGRQMGQQPQCCNIAASRQRRAAQMAAPRSWSFQEIEVNCSHPCEEGLGSRSGSRRPAHCCSPAAPSLHRWGGACEAEAAVSCGQAPLLGCVGLKRGEGKYNEMQSCGDQSREGWHANRQTSTPASACRHLPEASFRVSRSMAACSCSKPEADSGKMPAEKGQEGRRGASI